MLCKRPVGNLILQFVQQITLLEEVEEKIPASLLAADADEPIEQTTSDSLLDRK